MKELHFEPLRSVDDDPSQHRRERITTFSTLRTHTQFLVLFPFRWCAWARSEKLRVCEKGTNEKGTTAAARNICLWTRLRRVRLWALNTHTCAPYAIMIWVPFTDIYNMWCCTAALHVGNCQKLFCVADEMKFYHTFKIVKGLWSLPEKKEKGAGNFFLTFLSVFAIPFSFFSGNIHALFSTTCVLNAEQ